MKEDTQIQTLPVLGMTCAACAVSVESMIGSQKGVEKAEVNYATQEVKVTYNPAEIQTGAMQKAVQSIGYDLVVDTDNGKEIQEEAQRNHYDNLRKRLVASSILTMPVVIIGMFIIWKR